MEVFATFDIINDRGEKVAEGHKASFCLEDNQCLEGVEPRYACANYGDQGECSELSLLQNFVSFIWRLQKSLVKLLILYINN
jgi:hypothetical protein